MSRDGNSSKKNRRPPRGMPGTPNGVCLGPQHYDKCSCGKHNAAARQNHGRSRIAK